jgi:hypothetical protein
MQYKPGSGSGSFDRTPILFIGLGRPARLGIQVISRNWSKKVFPRFGFGKIISIFMISRLENDKFSNLELKKTKSKIDLGLKRPAIFDFFTFI